MFDSVLQTAKASRFSHELHWFYGVLPIIVLRVNLLRELTCPRDLRLSLWLHKL